ncbi:MAG: hypothetical protein KKB31_02110 [Nanoarchaeota archaeon]|nr:hypothetical protein [Nanoarchaeota archaeon]
MNNERYQVAVDRMMKRDDLLGEVSRMRTLEFLSVVTSTVGYVINSPETMQFGMVLYEICPRG